MSPTILSIDPGKASGLTVLTIGKRPQLLEWVHYKFTKKTRQSPTSVVSEFVSRYDIKKAAIEDQFHLKNVRSLISLSRTAGRWEEACESNGLVVEYVTSQRLKQGMSYRSMYAMPTVSGDLYRCGRLFFRFL